MMNSNTSQAQQILRHMTEYGGITSYEAFTLYGITRLSGRIYDLRRRGYNVRYTRLQCKNRNGQKCYYYKYYLDYGEAADGK